MDLTIIPAGYKTYTFGSIGAVIVALLTYFNAPPIYIQALGFITLIVQFICIRSGMKTETEKKIQAYAEQLTEVTRIILNKGNLVDDTSTTNVEQKPAPVLPESVEIKMSDGSVKTVPISELSQDFLAKL